MNFKITELRADFAVEVTGLDLSQRLSAEDFCAIREAWFKAGVMVIRDQYITPAEQVAFSRQFGSLGIHVLDQFRHPDQKEILVLSNKKNQDGSPVGFEDAGRYWHSDLSYAQLPMLGSILYALEIPPQGGETLFADMRKSLETLPETMRGRLEGLKAYHSYTCLLYTSPSPRD